jgi:DNA-binding NarL/FixJ family response regulator
MRQQLIEITLIQNSEQLRLVENFLEENLISFKVRDKIMGTNSTTNIDFTKLSSKDVRVLDLMSQGLRYKQIAEHLEMTVDGVRYYVKKIYKFLGVTKNASAVSFYLQHMKN